ncbi:CsbD family protein [Microbacterium sp. zg.Y1090]|uniref:CsbD family protein n=1 Tax=Microbacterium TaxID=33882 RepID=UPI00214AB1ED|nr:MULTISPECIES: CsbD family protein [unclassified Microbacterium]MCR2814115.1 CsbD family protein [Microbacterium sp. zg.Y1084]MCR2817880.1 CsbD family protein [Microbacterium sp. zg.Y1090]MDL5487734.1 CsbD family protein [Microbacterium sp. zg-Y1211]WIM27951.1 CsbD family protein [Microbacterium sp. zg-Y1090]
MGIGDDMKHKGEELKGQAKEGIGKATGDKSMETEGHVDQAKGKGKQAVDEVKDAVTDK